MNSDITLKSESANLYFSLCKMNCTILSNKEKGHKNQTRLVVRELTLCNI